MRLRKYMVCILLLAFFLGCISNVSDESKIRIDVCVINDEPPKGAYEKIPGEPKTVGVYILVMNETLPGASYFEKIDEITLKKVNDSLYCGSKIVNKIKGKTICVGYPPSNFIDKNTCPKIDQNLTEIKVTIHYWKPIFAISGKSNGGG